MVLDPPENPQARGGWRDDPDRRQPLSDCYADQRRHGQLRGECLDEYLQNRVVVKK
jgi:hypothetical protein